MKIALVAPLYEQVPPKLYGGTERVVSWITEELVAQGHEVTLFASGDSTTSARLVPTAPRALRLEESYLYDKAGFHILMMEKVLKQSSEFDIVHFHTDYLHLPYVRLMETPSLTTLHCRLDYLPLLDILQHHIDEPVVPISNSQRKVIPFLNWQKTIHHGLPRDMYHLNEHPSDYALFIGRLCPEKRPDRAIEIAQRAGIHLKIAAKVDPVDREYFAQVIRPLLDGPGIEFLGEVSDEAKQELIGNAFVLIHPIEFPEPFGLVMIESMACGTPTIAFRRGSIPEVIDEGVTGFVVDDVEGAVSALERIATLDRRMCRQIFETRFTATRMVHDYVDVYSDLAEMKTALTHSPPRNEDSRSSACPSD